jgi:hypothetical protein
MAVFWVIALVMEAARTSETLVNFYQTTRHYNPEDGHLLYTQCLPYIRLPKTPDHYIFTLKMATVMFAGTLDNFQHSMRLILESRSCTALTGAFLFIFMGKKYHNLVFIFMLLLYSWGGGQYRCGFNRQHSTMRAPQNWMTQIRGYDGWRGRGGGAEPTKSMPWGRGELRVSTLGHSHFHIPPPTTLPHTTIKILQDSSFYLVLSHSHYPTD